MLDTLPPELLQLVFSRIELDHAARALAALQATCRATRHVAILPLLWEPLYSARWSRSSVNNDVDRHQQFGDDYLQKYKTRFCLDCTAEDLVDALIVTSPPLRTSGAIRMAALGCDVWDVLLNNAHRNAGARLIGPQDSWSRRYWSWHAVGLIARQEAVSRACAFETMRLEDAVADLSAFFGLDISDNSRLLDTLALQCQEVLVSSRVVLPSNSQHFNADEFCVAVCAWMRDAGFRPARGDHYFRLMNHFAHTFLTSHRETLPMSLVVVFLSVTRRLGLSAAPVNFPGQVLVRVHRQQNGQDCDDDFFVDVYDSEISPILSYGSVEARLQNIPQEHRAQYMRSAGTMEMIARAARNIMHSLRTPSHSDLKERSNHLSAWYAALNVLSHTTEDPDGNYPLRMVDVTHDAFPLDIQPIILQTLVPGLYPDIARRVELDCARRKRDSIDSQSVSLRTGEIKFAVGQIIFHKRYNYFGVIFSWHGHCSASESWINLMSVDALPGGRTQPFYHVFALLEDSSPERYVASCNIIPAHKCPDLPADGGGVCSVCGPDIAPLSMPPFWELVEGLYSSHTQLGRYFTHAEEGASGYGRFLLSPESKASFPEDDTFTTQFMV